MKKYCELKNEERHINIKIEQQNHIKEFLNEEFGADKGKELFNKQEMILDEIIKNIKDKSENQRKTLGKLKKLGFSRTKTLGYGGDCCDFHFYRK